jgi:hypothetical protein
MALGGDVTSQTESTPAEKPPVGQIIGPFRELAALILVGVNALWLFTSLLGILWPDGDYSTFAGRAGTAYYGLVNLWTITLPLIAVLLANIPRPAVGQARVITLMALIEYAVSGLFGGLISLVSLINSLADLEIRGLFFGLTGWAKEFALLGLAAFLVLRIWQVLYHVPKPKPQPGLYGQPQQPGYGPQPGGYPGYGPQANYGTQPGYAPPAQPGQPYGQQPGYPGGYPQGYAPPGFPPPTGAAATYGVPAPVSAPPVSAPPGPAGEPTSGAQAPGAAPVAPSSVPTPPAASGVAEATQVIRQDPAGDTDRTQRINPGGPTGSPPVGEDPHRPY